LRSRLTVTTYISLTIKAAIGDFQVGSDIWWTGVRGVDDVVGHSATAVLSSGAYHFDVFQNVRLAVDVAERALNTPPDLHAAVERLLN